MTIGTKTAEIRSARRCTGALPVWASSTSRAIWASCGVGADAGRPHDEPAAGVDGGAGDGVAGADLDRHALAGEQRRVDRRRALLDDAVGGDLLAGPHDEAVADGELLDRDAHLGAVAQHGDVLGAELEQRPQRGAGAPLGPGLEVAAGEDERRHAGGDLEVDLARPHAALGAERERRAHRRARRRRRGTARTATSRTRRATPTEISVSIVAARVAQVRPTRPGGTATRPTSTTGAASVSDSHCQSSNCSAGTIASSDHRAPSSSAETISRWRERRGSRRLVGRAGVAASPPVRRRRGGRAV